MIRLFFILVCLTLIALLVLSERQKTLDLGNKLTRLHQEIHQSQTDLWRQQVQIATMTNPAVVERIME